MLTPGQERGRAPDRSSSSTGADPSSTVPGSQQARSRESVLLSPLATHRLDWYRRRGIAHNRVLERQQSRAKPCRLYGRIVLTFRGRKRFAGPGQFSANFGWSDGRSFHSSRDAPPTRGGTVHIWRARIEHFRGGASATGWHADGRQASPRGAIPFRPRPQCLLSRPRMAAQCCCRGILACRPRRSAFNTARVVNRNWCAEAGVPTLSLTSRTAANSPCWRLRATRWSASISNNCAETCPRRWRLRKSFHTGRDATARRLPQRAEMLETFFRLWTRKESVIKAVGTGLSLPLVEFDCSSAVTTGEAWHVVQVASLPGRDWALRDLQLGARLSRRLCVAGPGRESLLGC